MTASSVPQLLGENVRDKIANCKVLVVGAGGIGCEILKNLALSGFKNIELIDLDTIDVSNLNRQFLFRKEHVGKSKSMVARESITSFNPDINIKAYHDSITTSQFGVNFFKNFDIVLNALDNRVARNHVNRMCLAADVPLIESGTSGYTGQVELIRKGITQCYECQPKPPQKSFPGCTIRNTPSEPVHCIVWAKHLFNQLFGEDDPDQDVSPDTADPEAAGDAGEEAIKSQNDDGNIERVSTRQWAQNLDYEPAKLFNKFFEDDVKYLLSMDNLWKTRKPPAPLMWSQAASHEGDVVENGLSEDMQVWSLSKCTKVFAESVSALKKDLENKSFLVWDKDDKPALDFVTACANIRAHIFSIPQKTRFDVKSIAGNIIPAIATTNAIVAGFAVLHTFKLLAGEQNRCTNMYVRPKSSVVNTLICAENNLLEPNPNCYVCSPQPFVNVYLDVSSMTVKEFENDILKKSLNMIAPDVVLDGKGVVVISSEEGETECNNNKKLNQLEIVDGSILKVDDFLQNYELTVCVNQYVPKEKDDPPYKVAANEEVIKSKPEEPKSAAEDREKAENGVDKPVNSHQKVRDGDDELEVIEHVAADDADAGASSAKRRKLNDDDDDLICTDDQI